MLKFLRKYSKWILVVGGSLLMVAFLLPQALQSLGQGAGNRTLMVVDGRRVKADEFFEKTRGYTLVSTLLGQSALPQEGIESRNHWYLLVEEARRSGLIGGPQSGERFISQYADRVVRRFESQAGQSMGPGFSDDLALQLNQGIDSIANGETDISATREQILQALAEFAGVLRLKDSWVDLARVSDRRVKVEGRRVRDIATVAYRVYPAGEYDGEIREPTDEELLEHYQTYKDTRPGEGEYGVGYLLPPRVKLEWVTFEALPVLRAVTVDPVEVERLMLTRGDDPELATLTEDNARRRIQSNLRDREFERVMRAVEQAVAGQVALAKRTLPEDGDFRVLPDDWASKRPSLEDVATKAAERVSLSTGVEIPPGKVTRRVDGWLTAADLAQVPQFGAARSPDGSSAPELVLSVRELAPAASTGLQVGLLSETPLIGPDGARIFFRVTEARRESPPDSMEEIRDDVVRDWRAIRAFEELRERTAEFAFGYASGDVPPPDADAQIPTTDSFATVTRERALTPAGSLIDTEAFCSAAMDAASSVDASVDPESIPVEERTFAVALPEALSVVAGKVTRVSPLTREMYRDSHGQLVLMVVADERARTDAPDPYSWESMSERLDVRIVDRDDDEGDG